MVYTSNYIRLEVRCNMCMWKGEEEDLVRFEDEDGFGKGCPKCETDGYLIDVKGGLDE